MKKLLLLLLLIPFYAHSASIVMMSGKGTSTAAPSATNYCNDANMMGCWYMNVTGSGAETDRTSNGNDLAVSSGSLNTSATVPSGYSGSSRTFTAAGTNYLTIADGTELDINGASAKVSLGAWVYMNTAAASVVIAKHSGGNVQYRLIFTGTLYGRCIISSDGSAETYATTTKDDFTTGTWYHVACVYDGTDIRMYINGDLNGSPTSYTSGIYNGGGAFTIGDYNNYGDHLYFDGLIDEAFVANRALSSTEIGNIYTNGLTGTKGGSD